MIPQIHHCLATDELRPVMQHAFISPKEVAASDAHILVVHSTDDLFPATFVNTIPEEGLFFPRPLLIDLAKPSAIDLQIVKISDTGELIMVTHQPKGRGQSPYRTYFEFIRGEADGKDEEGEYRTPRNSWVYPAYQKVFPTTKTEPMENVNLKPEYLLRLEKGMTSSKDRQESLTNVKLIFYGYGKAILVKSLRDTYPSCRGLIMPVMESQ